LGDHLLNLSRDNKYKDIFKLIATILGVLSFFILLMMFFSVHHSEDWKQYQLAYRDSLKLNADDSLTQSMAENLPIQIQQITVNQLSISDRCTSCHYGIENKSLPISISPFQTHPGSYLDEHNLTDYGCTTCHGGQGRALEKAEAHSQQHAGPFLGKKYLQTNCGKCHLLVYQKDTKLPGIDKLQQGILIFQREGCLGCHKIRGTGGAIGPDLTGQGDKTHEAYDYSRISGEHNIETWLHEHFLNPDKISPGSKMPAFNISPDSLLNLIIFTRALFPANLPFSYYNSAVLREYKNDRNLITDTNAFDLFCVACHGKSGVGIDYEKSKFGVPHLSNQDFLRLASREMIFFSIHEGRGTRMMGSWNPEYSGMRMQELQSLVRYVQSWKNPAPSSQQISRLRGNRSDGKEIFQKDCAMCHGLDGNGGIGPGLNRQSLLANADREFFFETISIGRANTAMPSWNDMTAQNIVDVIEYIMEWQTQVSNTERFRSGPGNFARGDSLYHYSCARCHGTTGSGGIGPAILYPDFLAAASDNFIKKTILGGRDHSVMFGLKASKIDAEQKQEQLNDLTTFIRSWEDSTRKFIEAGPDLGNPEYGKILYRRFCSECHGNNGEGIKAPALNNQEFLNAASNGYIIGTISIGRKDTKMPSWGRGTETYPQISTQDRWDIVAFIRQWQLVEIPIPNN
jgi:mono/diheme cytochrome c family protein